MERGTTAVFRAACSWNFQYLTIKDRSNTKPLPCDVANAIAHASGFTFCASGIPSPSFLLILALHPLEGYIPYQCRARAEAWKRIETLPESEVRGNAQVTGPSCACGEQLDRAVHRLGIDAQTLEAVRREAIGEVGGSVDRLASLASAALVYRLNVENTISRVREFLSVHEDGQYYTSNMLSAQRVVREFKDLAQALSSCFSTELSPLS